MATSTPYTKKTKGNCARFGGNLSSTIRWYHLILEFWYVIWGTLLFVRVYMVTSTSHAKKTKGTCASFGRDLSSTIQRYDLSLESPTLFTEKGSGNMKRTVRQTQSLSRDLLHFLELVVPNSPRFVEADLCGPT